MSKFENLELLEGENKQPDIAKIATHVLIILDRSGSMESIREDVIKNFNKFIDTQRKIPGDCFITLVQFDDIYEIFYKAELVQDVPKLDSSTYIPRAFTALLDAIGRGIVDLKVMLQDKNNSQVIVCIITDGLENASKEFVGKEGRTKIFDMITTLREKNKWEFIFLAANQDAIASGQQYGVFANLSSNFTADASGTSLGLSRINYMVGTARTRGIQSLSTMDINDISEKDLKNNEWFKDYEDTWDMNKKDLNEK